MAIIEGSTSGNKAEVDSSSRLKVINSGGLVDASGNDLRTTLSRHLDVSGSTRLFWDSFDDSAIDSRKWLQYLTTQTAAIASNFLVLNNGAVTTINTNSGIMSHQRFARGTEASLQMAGRVQLTNLPIVNAVAEWGFGLIASATDRSAPTDGAFFRWKADGACECVTSVGGAETSVAITAPSTGVAVTLAIEINAFSCVFKVNGTTVATITPTGAPITASGRLPAFVRVYNGAVAPASAPQFRVSSWSINLVLLDSDRSWNLGVVTAGQGGQWSPVTPYAGSNGSTNGLVLPAAVAQSNTAAPISTLGGRVNYTAMAGADLAAPVDALHFAYQVPVGLRFVCTGILVSVQNAGAAVATTPHTLEFSLATGATAASLATADSFAASPQPTYAPRKVYLGMASLPVAAAIGALAGDIVRDFSAAPIVCEGGKFIAGIMRCTVGTATASQTLRVVMQPYGFFE